MAIDLTLKSVAITNREATPKVSNSPGIGGASKVKSVKSTFAALTASLSITSIIRMIEIPSNAVVLALYGQSAAQTAGKFDIGIYRTNADGGAVVDKDFFASSWDLGAAVVKTELLNEAAINTIAKQNQQIWDALGESVDPHSTYDICLVVTAEDVTTGLGAINLECQYTD